MTKQIINMAATEALYTTLGISEAVRVGSSIYISGQVGWDDKMVPAATFDAQVRLAFSNMASVLEKAGTSFESIVDLKMFLVPQPNITLMEMVDLAFSIKCELFPDNICAATAIGIGSLVMPELMLECAATAHIA